MRIWTSVLAALAAICLVAPSAAQTMTVTGGATLSVGDVVVISYTGGTPGATITVTMDDGLEGGPTQTRQITLDGTGEGSVDWTVPSWWLVNFNAPNVNQVTKTVNPAPEDG